eukprot:c11083_g1_i1.p1 GENE.c11083_g1_i1~~c11083_g1_i1.p1  ORF type:complete len:404 (+),score=90.85 c11083_g1_i1:58-1212(+)
MDVPLLHGSSSHTYQVDDAIEHLGFGAFHRRMIVLCGFGLMMDVLLLNKMAFLLPVLKDEWELSKTSQGLLGSATYAGMVLGAYFWGQFSDKKGRRLGFIWTILVASAAGLLSSFCHTEIMMAACRVVVGFGVGGNSPLAFTLFSEIIPVKDRGFHMILIDVFAPLGMLLSCTFAYITLSGWTPVLGWRSFCVFSSMPGLFVLAFARHITESPRFFARMGRHAEAKNVLFQMSLQNHHALPAGTLATPANTSLSRAPPSLGQLFHNKSFVATTLLLWVLWVGLQLGSTGIHIWLPTFFHLKGILEQDVPRVVLFTAFGEIPGLILAAMFVDRLGRRKVSPSPKTLRFSHSFPFLLLSGLRVDHWVSIYGSRHLARVLFTWILPF